MPRAGEPPAPRATGNPIADMQTETIQRMQEQMLAMQKQLFDLTRKP
jgi:hypothetical protein